VRSLKQMISTIHTIIGGVMLGVGAFIFILSFFFDHNAAVLSLQITGGVLAFTGIVELTISVIFRNFVRREQANLARLKAEGQSFQGEITQIHRHMGVRIGRSFSAYVDCSYKNNEGKTCLVRSKSFLYAPHDNYSAWVYVNPHNSHDYVVEIHTQPVTMQGVYDYR